MNDDRLREKIEILDGSRPRQDPRRAAARIDDLAGILALPAKLKSAKAAGATPTKAEFDALVDDVTMIHNRLTALREALQKRIL